MDNALSWFSRLVTVRPWVTLLVLLLLTVALAAGAALREPPPDAAAALPDGSPITEAIAEIEERFGESGEVRVSTLLFRGEALTPDGLSQMDTLIDSIVMDPAVGEYWLQQIPSSHPR